MTRKLDNPEGTTLSQTVILGREAGADLEEVAVDFAGRIIISPSGIVQPPTPEWVTQTDVVSIPTMWPVITWCPWFDTDTVREWACYCDVAVMNVNGYQMEWAHGPGGTIASYSIPAVAHVMASPNSFYINHNAFANWGAFHLEQHVVGRAIRLGFASIAPGPSEVTLYWLGRRF